MTMHSVKQFSVDSAGAYLVDLYDGAGQQILFPRTTIDGKRRGGSHVCLPYFGADAAGLLPQHGFGRDARWRVTKESDHAIVCTYSHGEADMFRGLAATLRYELAEDERSLTATLIVENRGDSPMPVSPGFHPYFAVDPADVRLNGTAIDLADFEPYKDYLDTNEMMLETAGRTIKIASGTLRHMVVWTNLQADFLCVEPTLSGHSFNSTRPSDFMLEPKTHIQYEFTISW